ncbi:MULTISPECIES: class I adenylate-forming enzyme family protein [unclassified Rhodococcus (in: high G+C Gram-positive bacteria)]|uniref:class I adenylate-forming enzyme family protein n=1 Tax=unclassified Rhodococcus (in: high G+C Gram-positive bacteria) TaxID=192944 RepID=UPI001483A9F0|nr:class I adenylate-forming enzyme family protein [Rhodococcus sp. M8]QPG44123.1 acyl--CoA ligase [Rhodococcus sp. M8]
MHGSQLPALNEDARPGWSYAPLSVVVPWTDEDDITVGQRVALAARRHPTRSAIVWIDNMEVCAVSWGDLHRRASAIGGHLQRMLPSNARVGVLGRNRLQWIHAFYGAACAGYGVVPLPDEGADSLARYCGAVGVDLVLTTDNVGVRPEDVENVRVVPIGGLSDLGAVAYRPNVNGANPDDPFLYQFTSGTTGTPKVAVLSHRAVLGAAAGYAHATGASDGDAMFNPLPLEHVGGSVAGLLGTLAIDGAYVAVDRFDAGNIAEVVRTTAPSVVGLVPTMLVDLLNRGAVQPTDFVSVSSIVGGAASVDPALIDRVEAELGIRFLVGYGQSEAPCLTVSGVDDPAILRTRTIGRPLPGRDYCIAVDGVVAREGQVGELCVRGPLIMSGYLAEDGSITRVVDENGWMRTGDLCSMSDGIVRFHSRVRDVVIRGGENLYPVEIESVVLEYPGVQEAAAFGIPDVRLGERLAVAVLCGPDRTPDLVDLDRFVAERLPRRKRPSEWFLVDDFPRTSTGKVRKAELADRLAPRVVDGTPPVPDIVN